MSVPPSPSAVASLPEWHGSHSGRFLALLFVGAVVVSYRFTEVRPLTFLEPQSLANMWAFARGMLPPAHSLDFFRTVARPLLETIQVGLLGTLLAALLGFPLGLLATNSLFFAGPLHDMDSRHFFKRSLLRLPYLLARLLLNILRAIPELVWALIFVRALGLGAAPGILALSVSYSGMLGKVYADLLEAVDPAPLEALQNTGATRVQLVLYGWLPQVLPNALGYTLYRWECALRAATLMGFVGAGGIGQAIELSMRMFEYQEAVSLILLIFVLSTVVERVGDSIRRSIV